MEERPSTHQQQAKRPSSALTIDRAAFLLLRVKKAFKKKKHQRKEKNAAAAAAAAADALTGMAGAVGGPMRKQPPPLLRSRTLPSIPTSGYIIQAQFDPRRVADQAQANQSGPGMTSTLKLRAHTPRISFQYTELDANELRRRSASSRLGYSPSPRPSISSTGSESVEGKRALRVPSPHSDTRSRVSMSGATNRIARFLTHKQSPPPVVTYEDVDTGTRRLSWERREKFPNALFRSNSIDSLVEAVWTSPRRSEPATIPVPTSRQDRTLSLISPAIGRRNKIQRGVAELPYGALLEGCAGELPSLSACAPHAHHHSNTHRRQCDSGSGGNSKMTKKQTKESAHDRLSQVNIHLQALFAAVENGHMEKARNILESTDVDVNSRNSDGLSPLDVAFLVNNRPLVRVLMENGAKEGSQFTSPDAVAAHLRRLASDAEARLHDLIGCIASGSRTCSMDMSCTRSTASTSSASTGCAGGTGSDREKQTFFWEKRLRALKRLSLGWNQSRVPDPPAKPDLEVCGTTTVAITLRENTTTTSGHEAAIFTKYKVQWSSRSDFSNICGSREVNATPGTTRVIASGLTRGRRYFFRAQAGNLKGWGEFAYSIPCSVVPSCWQDVVPIIPKRYSNSEATMALDRLYDTANSCRATPLPRPRHRKTATIRQLFTAASKFQKYLKRGVYLACVFYHDDKILVTNDETLPAIEIDDTYPTGLFNDFYWLMRVASCWEDVKALRSELEKQTSSFIHFRLKLLTTVLQMQAALCVQDLGQIHHKIIRDSDGSLVICCVRNVKTPKSMSALNSKWIPISRLLKNVTALSDDNTINELLVASVNEQIFFHQAAANQLPRGLYLGYLKLQSSIELIRIVVTSKHPNIMPYAKIRDNPHVSADEWDHVRSFHPDKDNTPTEEQSASVSSLNQDTPPSESQTLFINQIRDASNRLFSSLDVVETSSWSCRLYETEIIDLTPDVSFIIVSPPSEAACVVPGQMEKLLQKEYLQSLPILAFEMIHLNAYQNEVLTKYSRLNCFLEIDVALANHAQREAFSNSELQIAKEKLANFEDLQNQMNEVWKKARWLTEVISFARDKVKTQKQCGIPLGYMFDKEAYLIVKAEEERKAAEKANAELLQLPDGKAAKPSTSRGSWPGPSTSGNNFHQEMSRSEQLLSSAPTNTTNTVTSPPVNFFGTQLLSATSNFSKENDEKKSIPHSTTSQHFLCLQDVNFRLPASKSQDAFFGVTNIGKEKNKLFMKPSPSPSPHNKHRSDTMVDLKLALLNNLEKSPLNDMKTTVLNSLKEPLDPSRTTQLDNSGTLPLDKLNTSPLDIPHPDRKKFPKKAAEVEFPMRYTRPPGVKSWTNYKHQVEAIVPIRQFYDTDSFLGPELGLVNVYKKPSAAPIDLSTPSDGYAESGILQVFAAYDTGLAVGTSLKLHVTQRTTAREVIHLVVKQLYMAAILKGKIEALVGLDKLNDFCLVAVIGARERCLRDDFRPLLLQNPWRKGKLYVRLKHDVLAALHQSTKPYDFI